MGASCFPPGGDSEFIDGKFAGQYVSLITYTNAGSGVCAFAGVEKQSAWARPVDPIAGLPVSEETERMLADDECGNPGLSDAEWGTEADLAPLLIYTTDDGVRVVFRRRG